jgi:hypothetical protein
MPIFASTWCEEFRLKRWILRAFLAFLLGAVSLMVLITAVFVFQPPTLASFARGRAAARRNFFSGHPI